MPTKQQVCTAVETHIECWNSQRRKDWIANFADDMVFNDPVGAPPQFGKSAAQASWDNSFSKEQLWTLELTQWVACADEAPITLKNHERVGGQDFVMDGIEIWRVGEQGLDCEVRAYFELPENVELDSYFHSDENTAS